MKKQINLVLAAACLLASSLYFSSCQKDIRKPEQARVETTTAPAQSSFGARAGAAEASESDGYTLTAATVELTDEGRENLIASKRSEMKQTGELSFLTIRGGGNTYDPPLEPIICDGMTRSQLWMDIDQKLANFVNSPAGQAMQARANATCQPQFYGICNCYICMLCMMLPNRPCFSLEEAVRADRIDMTLVKIE